MLSALAIKNFAIIDDLSIEFTDHFSVLTGETGAGKSIIIQAVNLLLGGRASADLVRNGEDQAELTAFFEIEPDSDSARQLEAQGMDASEGLIVRRLIMASGKSRVYVNSNPATLDFLKKVTGNLAGVSSQHAHQGLLREENHLDILDEFAGTLDQRAAVESLYRQLLPLKARKAELEEEIAQHQKEQEFIQFQVDEIIAADIQPGEDESLEARQTVLKNAARTFEAVNRALYEIHGREGAMLENLASLTGELERYVQADEALAGIARQMSTVRYDLEDAADGLRSYGETIDLDPSSLDRLEERLDLVTKLKRKYGPGLDDLFATLERLESQLSSGRDAGKQVQALDAQIQACLAELGSAADRLSRDRKAAADRLSRLAAGELAGLEMGQARFEAAFDVRKSDSPDAVTGPDNSIIGPSGLDRVRFLLSPNPGEPLKPLVKIASGGELSRIVLALKAVLSHRQALETLIFDEVDAGIGGATSDKVGLKLFRLSQSHQVICITHLAQIARYAGAQFRIRKQVEKGRTFTTIQPLSEREERVKEIARMIGGESLSPATLAHAREMLETAGA